MRSDTWNLFSVQYPGERREWNVALHSQGESVTDSRSRNVTVSAKEAQEIIKTFNLEAEPDSDDPRFVFYSPKEEK